MAERRNNDRRHLKQDYLMTDSQVAEMAKVPIRTVRYWRCAGILPSVKVGRHPRVWCSVFQKLFHRPDANGSWELVAGSDKMPTVRDVRGRH
jgi:hypothetical protein